MKCALVALCLMFTLGCVPTNPPQSPAASAASKADEVVQRLNELQAAVIQAEANKSLATPVARKIIQFTVDGDTVALASASGWQAAIQALWAALVKDVGGIFQDARTQAAWKVVVALMGGL